MTCTNPGVVGRARTGSTGYPATGRASGSLAASASVRPISAVTGSAEAASRSMIAAVDIRSRTGPAAIWFAAVRSRDSAWVASSGGSSNARLSIAIDAAVAGSFTYRNGHSDPAAWSLVEIRVTGAPNSSHTLAKPPQSPLMSRKHTHAPTTTTSGITDSITAVDLPDPDPPRNTEVIFLPSSCAEVSRLVNGDGVDPMFAAKNDPPGVPTSEPP